jgi:hypothetical protein
VLPSRLILFDLTFSLVPGPLFLLASVAFKVSALVSLHYGQQMLANFLGVLPILTPYEHMIKASNPSSGHVHKGTEITIL